MYSTIRILAMIAVALSIILFMLISCYSNGSYQIKRSLSDYKVSPCIDQCAAAFAMCNKNCDDQIINSPCLNTCNNAANICKSICNQNIFS